VPDALARRELIAWPLPLPDLLLQRALAWRQMILNVPSASFEQLGCVVAGQCLKQLACVLLRLSIPLACKSGSPPCITAPNSWEDEPRVVWGSLDSYNTPGRYPEVAEGVVTRAVCFRDDQACSYQAPVEVVRCAGFLLWRLPYMPTGAAGGQHCDRAYCTAPSGPSGGR
jgi:hypothetical protein